MSNPHKPGTPEWQQWINDQVAKHDAGKNEHLTDAETRKDAAEELANQRKRNAGNPNRKSGDK